MMRCPKCELVLTVTVDKKDEFFHIIEHCNYCGYVKAYVDYLDDDTGELDYSGIEH